MTGELAAPARRGPTLAECLAAIAFWRREQWAAATAETERAALRIRGYRLARAVHLRRRR